MLIGRMLIGRMLIGRMLAFGSLELRNKRVGCIISKCDGYFTSAVSAASGRMFRV